MRQLNQNKSLHIAAFTLMAIGGINWGLVGLLNLNLINLIFSGAAIIERLIYILVGVASVYIFATHKRDCRICGAGRQT